MPYRRIARVNRAVKKKTARWEARATHKIFYRSTGTRVRPGQYLKPRVSKGFRGSRKLTRSARKAGWKSAKTFGRARMSPLNLLPKSGKAKNTDAARARHRKFWRRQRSKLRWRNKSRGGEHTSRSRTPKTRKSIRGPSAHQKRSGLSSKSKSGQYIRRSRMTKRDAAVSTRGARTRTTLFYRKGGCPPGYRYDPRRKMCVRTN